MHVTPGLFRGPIPFTPWAAPVSSFSVQMPTVFALVSTVTFSSGFELERGEHTSAHHSHAAAKAPTVLPATEPHDAVELGTTMGLVLIMVGVAGWSCVAFSVRGRWVGVLKQSQ
jgi:hypothetical protein